MNLMFFVEHPGFLEYANGLFEVLDANWPEYPLGHGWEPALRSLAIFPPNIRFRQIDAIDQCFLFVATGIGPRLEPQGNLYNANWFHVAVWHEDLIELHERGLVSGMSLLTAYEEAAGWYEQHKHILDLPAPRREQLDDEQRSIMRIAPEGIGVTGASADILNFSCSIHP